MVVMNSGFQLSEILTNSCKFTAMAWVSWLPNQMISLIFMFGFLCRYFDTQMTKKYSTAMCYGMGVTSRAWKLSFFNWISMIDSKWLQYNDPCEDSRWKSIHDENAFLCLSIALHCVGHGQDGNGHNKERELSTFPPIWAIRASLHHSLCRNRALA